MEITTFIIAPININFVEKMFEYKQKKFTVFVINLQTGGKRAK